MLLKYGYRINEDVVPDGGVYRYTIRTNTLNDVFSFGRKDNWVMKDLLTVHLPFGEPRADVGLLSGTDKAYTGQRDMPGTGLMDYKARIYDPWLGRFVQPDSIVPGPTNPQS